MKKKLMITGATGFLGSHFVDRVDASRYEVHKHSRSTMDLSVFSEVKQAVSDVVPDIIVHIGGYVNLSRNFEAAKGCIDTNITGTLHLVEALQSRPPSLGIYVSTEEVYGNAPVPYREETLPHPPSPYAMTKVAGEHLFHMYGRYCGFPVIILRVSTMYGPGDNPARLIPTVIQNALAGAEIPLNSGKKMRDYVFVCDVVDALLSCLEAKAGKETEVINIGGGMPYTLKDVVEKIIRLCHSASRVRYGAFPDRPLEADVWEMDILKARKLLGWHPKTSLEDGLRQTIAYQKEL